MSSASPSKRLIVCCDGTWQSSNSGTANIPSNIARLARSIATRDETTHQIVYYSSGVGTALSDAAVEKSWNPITHIGHEVNKLYSDWAGGTGAGLDDKVCEAYDFLANNYNEGDEVYFFGFSRGAYTARAAAGLVAEVGLVRKDLMDGFFDMYTAYKDRATGASLRDTAWEKTEAGQEWTSNSTDVPIKFVGVFDTVGALGIPQNKWFNTTSLNHPFEFHNTSLHPKIEYAVQALALAEHREPFTPCLWDLSQSIHALESPSSPHDKNHSSKLLLQCWFPGTHVNVGGGNSDQITKKDSYAGDYELMSTVTFAWMVDRVEQFTPLKFDSEALKLVAKGFVKSAATVLALQNKPYKGLGVGPFFDSLTGLYEKLGSEIRHPGEYFARTNEYIHPIAKYAGSGDLEDPKKAVWPDQALARFKRRVDGQGKGFKWVKEEKGVEIPEFRIPQELGGGRFNMERYLINQDLGRLPSDNVVERAREFMRQLDEAYAEEENDEQRVGGDEGGVGTQDEQQQQSHQHRGFDISFKR